jgi:hypothetical protein
MRVNLLCLLFIASISSHAYSFSFPQHFWPQKDMDSSSVNDSTLGKKVLIASRDSDYKRALVGKIKAAFLEDSVYVKCIGLKKLRKTDTRGYQAIVLLNTCLGWDWDIRVNAFLRGKTNASNVIVITTSSKGQWKPRRNRAGVDAVGTASETSGVEKLATEIAGKVRRILNKK